MTKQTLTSLAFIAGTLLLPACSENEVTVVNLTPGNVPIEVTAANATLTRVTADNKWEAADRIAILMMKPDGTPAYTSPASYTYKPRMEAEAPNGFEPVDKANTAYYPKLPDKVQFGAWYPADAEVTVDANTISVGVPHVYDLLIATTTAAYDEKNTKVSLQFKHAMVKMEVTVNVRDGLTDQVKLEGAKLKIYGPESGAIWNLATGTVSPDGTMGNFNADVVATTEGANTVYKATTLVYPTAANTPLTFTLTDGNNKKFETGAVQNVTLEAGKINTFAMTLSPKVEVAFTGSIDAWENKTLGDITGDQQ